MLDSLDTSKTQTGHSLLPPSTLIMTSGFQSKGGSERKETLKKAAGGAGLGAAFGAIAGDAGKGAAIGTVSGVGVSMTKKG
jgi:hypothetical protein